MYSVFTLDLEAIIDLADMHRLQTFMTSYCLYKYKLVNMDSVDIPRMPLRTC